MENNVNSVLCFRFYYPLSSLSIESLRLIIVNCTHLCFLSNIHNCMYNHNFHKQDLEASGDFLGLMQVGHTLNYLTKRLFRIKLVFILPLIFGSLCSCKYILPASFCHWMGPFNVRQWLFEGPTSEYLEMNCQRRHTDKTKDALLARPRQRAA